MVGLALNAVGFGVILLRITNRPPRWVFADHLVYDPRRHQMVVWLWNRDARSFYNANATIFAGRALPQGASARVNRVGIHIAAGPPSVLPPGRTVLIRAESAPPEQQLSQEASETTSLGPCVLRSDDYVQVIFNAIADDSGATFFVQRIFRLKDVRCGRRKNVLPVGESEPDWIACDYDQFGKIVATPVDECRRCLLHASCPLDVAIAARFHPS